MAAISDAPAISSTVSVFFDRPVSDDMAPDAVDLTSDVAISQPFIGAASLSLCVSVRLAGSDDVMDCWRLSLTSVVPVLPFTVAFFGFDRFVDGETTVSRCVTDLSSAAGFCAVSVFAGSSVPLTGDDVFRELVTDPERVADVISCCLEGSTVVSNDCVAEISAAIDVGGDAVVTAALTLSAVFDDVPTPYVFIRSARDDAVYSEDEVYGVDLG